MDVFNKYINCMWQQCLFWRTFEIDSESQLNSKLRSPTLNIILAKLKSMLFVSYKKSKMI